LFNIKYNKSNDFYVASIVLPNGSISLGTNPGLYLLVQRKRLLPKRRKLSKRSQMHSGKILINAGILRLHEVVQSQRLQLLLSLHVILPVWQCCLCIFLMIQCIACAAAHNCLLPPLFPGQKEDTVEKVNHEKLDSNLEKQWFGSNIKYWRFE
jgi:hypothetical protein